MTILRNTHPHYIHDCKTCIFLGSEVQEGTIVDLYIHVNELYFSIITRKGSDGPNYSCYTVERRDRAMRSRISTPV